MSGLGERRARLAARLRRRRTAGDRLLRAFAAAYPEATFVEIGANDGAQGDHLRRYVDRGRWGGVMVEPNPSAFARLRAGLGGNPRVALENAAISSREGTLPFFEVSPPVGGERELSGSYDLLGSLDREALVTLPFLRDATDRVVETEVRALTLPSLLAKHGIERPDLLAIDTEGHDFEILKQVDTGQGRPRLIVYEHCLLAPADRAAARELLAEAGYELLEEFFDTYALDTSIDDAVTRRWRRLEPAMPAVSLREP